MYTYYNQFVDLIELHSVEFLAPLHFRPLGSQITRLKVQYTLTEINERHIKNNH